MDNFIDPKSGLAVVDDVFGLQLREQVECPRCRRVTQRVKSHTEYFHIVTATALRMIRMDSKGSMGALLNTIEQQHHKTCDKDEGGCGALNTPAKFLDWLPKVFTIQLAWDVEVTSEDIAATLAAVQERANLTEVRCGLQSGGA